MALVSILNSKHYSRLMARIAPSFLAIDHNPRGCKAKGHCSATSLDTVTSLKTVGRLFWKRELRRKLPLHCKQPNSYNYYLIAVIAVSPHNDNFSDLPSWSDD